MQICSAIGVIRLIQMKVFTALLMGIMLLSSSITNARSIRTPEGNMPLVHWAVVEATEGNMQKIIEIGSRVLAYTSAKEAGTYALYGALDVDNPDVMRLLEIYESNEAYRIHSSSEAFQQYRSERFPILKNLKLLEVNAIALEQKDTGTGTIVCMHRYEIYPNQLAEYQRLVTAEAVRAVRYDEGVMGIFVTAEHDNPNIIHTMEIFKDESSRQHYIQSDFFKKLQSQTKNMIQSQKDIENLPIKIILTNKGVAK